MVIDNDQNKHIPRSDYQLTGPETFARACIHTRTKKNTEFQCHCVANRVKVNHKNSKVYLKRTTSALRLHPVIHLTRQKATNNTIGNKKTFRKRLRLPPSYATLFTALQSNSAHTPLHRETGGTSLPFYASLSEARHTPAKHRKISTR